MIIGLISDTHGLLRPEALSALQKAAHIVHAGDVGNPVILDELRAIAPVTAVRGNVNTGAWADELPHEVTSTAECTESMPSFNRSTYRGGWARVVSTPSFSVIRTNQRWKGAMAHFS